jgi:RNA-directed DNA polymerase
VSVPGTDPPVDRTTVLQSKLYQAAKRDLARRFHQLYDKLYLSYVLQTAWELVKRNRGAAGIDQQTLTEIEAQGVAAFLAEITQSLREKTYRPQPVRRVLIPKPGESTRQRPLGIPTVRDRVVQAAAKLLLEPIFEADFEGTPSFGFRPGLGPQEALAVVTRNAAAGYRWVVDADIEPFFDRLDHQQLMAALRRRISDGELLRLIYRWLKAGYLLDGGYHDTDQGSPQGGVLSPLLANVYLSAFDRAQQEQKAFVGRLVRYADDFVIQCGTAEQAARALAWAREQLALRGLSLHPEKTRGVNDREDGFDFLGFHHHRCRYPWSRPERTR